MIKPGQIVTTELHPERFDGAKAINIGKNPPGIPGDPVMVAGVTSSRAYKIKRMSLAGSGNQNNANWRKRHGGSWVSPVNQKFKIKGS